MGLGKMGKGIVAHLLTQKFKVVVWNRSKDDVLEMEKLGAEGATDFKKLVQLLPLGRVVWIMLPSGELVDEMIDNILPFLHPGDLIIDGGNSFYKDTLRRAKMLASKKIRFMDVGVSGGPKGARNGACLMIGGDKKDYGELLPLFKAIAAPNAYALFGQAGAGHFAKMVHNGIEYGMMEAIAEGAATLKFSGFNFQLSKVFKIYQNRSVIESRLVDWTREALEEDENLANISSIINATGEGEWTIKTAKELKVPVPVIAESFKVRQQSKNVKEKSVAGFRNKVVSAMRGKFGGHEVKKR